MRTHLLSIFQARRSPVLSTAELGNRYYIQGTDDDIGHGNFDNPLRRPDTGVKSQAKMAALTKIIACMECVM